MPIMQANDGSWVVFQTSNPWDGMYFLSKDEAMRVNTTLESTPGITIKNHQFNVNGQPAGTTLEAAVKMAQAPTLAVKDANGNYTTPSSSQTTVASSTTPTTNTTAVPVGGMTSRDHITGEVSYQSGNDIVKNAQPPSATPPPTGGMGAYTGIPGFEDSVSRLQDIYKTTGERTAPSVTPTAIGPVSTAQGATIGPMEQVTAPRLGPVAQAGFQSLGPAALAGAGGATGATATAAQIAQLQDARIAQLGPAGQAAESDVRKNQIEAMNYQGGLMRGENSVAAMEGKRQLEGLMGQQMAMGASARPGQMGMMARTAAQNMGRLGTDMAGRIMQAQQEERNQAATQYGSMAGTARGQDLSLNMYNTGQKNDFTKTQAGFEQGSYLQNASLNAQRAMEQGRLGTSANIATAGNQTQASIASANNATQASIASAEQQNTQDYRRASMAQEVELKNADARNEQAYRQGLIDVDTYKFNADAINRQRTNQANLDQQNNQFNSGQTNAYSLDTARIQNQANQWNGDAILRQTQLNDAGQANALSLEMGLRTNQGRQTLDAAMNTLDNATRLQIQAMIKEAQTSNDPKAWERVMSALAGAGLGFIAGTASTGNPYIGLATAAIGGVQGGLNGTGQVNIPMIPGSGGSTPTAASNPYGQTTTPYPSYDQVLGGVNDPNTFQFPYGGPVQGAAQGGLPPYSGISPNVNDPNSFQL